MKTERLAPESCNAISTICYLTGLGLLLTVAVLTCSCNPTKRLRAIDAKHPLATATFCAERFPVTENTTVRVDTVTDVQYLPAEPYYIDCDSARLHRTDTGRLLVHVPCPPAQLITRLVTKDSIVRVENRAAIVAARLTADKWQAKHETVIKWRNRFAWAAGIGWILIIGTVLIRLFRPRWL